MITKNNKTMTVEEKAKAYDIIIEKANKMHHENCEACQICIEELIPELKESEDEKIRKNIIKAFKVFKEKQAWVGHCLDDIDWDACISWLEKQSELVKNNMFLPFKEYDNLMNSINKKKKEGYEAGYKQGLIDSKSEHKI